MDHGATDTHTHLVVYFFATTPGYLQTILLFVAVVQAMVSCCPFKCMQFQFPCFHLMRTSTGLTIQVYTKHLLFNHKGTIAILLITLTWPWCG